MPRPICSTLALLLRSCGCGWTRAKDVRRSPKQPINVAERQNLYNTRIASGSGLRSWTRATATATAIEWTVLVAKAVGALLKRISCENYVKCDTCIAPGPPDVEIVEWMVAAEVVHDDDEDLKAEEIAAEAAYDVDGAIAETFGNTLRPVQRVSDKSATSFEKYLAMKNARNQLFQPRQNLRRQGENAKLSARRAPSVGSGSARGGRRPRGEAAKVEVADACALKVRAEPKKSNKNG